MERITLNIIPKGITPVCHASQFDIGRVIRCDIMDNLQGYVFSDETVELRVCKPDNNIVTESVDVVSGDTYVLIETTEQMTACDGVNKCELRIMKGNVRIGSLNFDMKVEVDPLKDGIESETVIHNLESMVDGMVAEDVAEQYDSSNVIFDEEPTENHGVGYTVTSEGIKTAIDNAFDYDNTASGSLVHFTDGADNIPVKSLVSQIVAVETGSGEKSPTNPYTISGFDRGVVSVCGKNLFNSALEQGTINSTTGGIIAGTTRCVNTDLIPIPQGVSRLSSNKILYEVAYFDKAKNFVTTGFFNTSVAILNTSYAYFRISIRNSDNSTILPSDITVQLELGNQATTYEAYKGNNYTFPFGWTVYGGHFDNKGNLVVTHKEIDLSTLSWSATTLGSQNVWRTSLPNDCKGYADNFVPTNIWCEQYEPNSVDNMYSGYSGVSLRTSGSYIYCSRTDLNEPQGKLIAELITPTSLTITSQDIPTLLGENNIFSNCGDVEVNYYTSKSNDILDFINSEIGKKNGTNIPIEENSQDSIKDYVDNEISGTKDYVDNGLSGKADNTDLPFVKYEEIDVTFDASGEGTLFNNVKFVVGLKDIPSDQLYVGYVSYIAGSTTKVKALSRTAIAFSSQNNVSSTRKVGVYYIDNIAT